MQVLLAEEYGFCFGVERAVEMVEGALASGATVRTLGPLIHNTQEIERLEAGGVRTIDAPAEVSAGLTAIAPYAVAMAYRVRFYMEMNAREAMHLIELRTAPQGHPAYRRVCQRMHTLIAERAGHRAVAAAMQFVDHSEVELERLNAERALEKRRG